MRKTLTQWAGCWAACGTGWFPGPRAPSLCSRSRRACGWGGGARAGGAAWGAPPRRSRRPGRSRRPRPRTGSGSAGRWSAKREGAPRLWFSLFCTEADDRRMINQDVILPSNVLSTFNCGYCSLGTFKQKIYHKFRNIWKCFRKSSSGA